MKPYSGPMKPSPPEQYEGVIEQHDPVDPLFLFYAPHVAHCPLQVPQEYYEKFDFMADDEGLCSQELLMTTRNLLMD